MLWGIVDQNAHEVALGNYCAEHQGRLEQAQHDDAERRGAEYGHDTAIERACPATRPEIAEAHDGSDRSGRDQEGGDWPGGAQDELALTEQGEAVLE